MTKRLESSPGVPLWEQVTAVSLAGFASWQRWLCQATRRFYSSRYSAITPYWWTPASLCWHLRCCWSDWHRDRIFWPQCHCLFITHHGQPEKNVAQYASKPWWWVENHVFLYRSKLDSNEKNCSWAGKMVLARTWGPQFNPQNDWKVEGEKQLHPVMHIHTITINRVLKFGWLDDFSV